MSWLNFVRGDEKAFEALYNEYVDDLFSYGIKYHLDKDAVLDCIHDLFVNIFNNPKIAKEVEIKFYLYSSLRRRLNKIKNERDRYQINILPEELLSISSPELDLIKKESEKLNLIRINKQIERLPKRQREVLFLRYYMDFSYEEIASIMEVSIESCRTLSYRAIKQLKNQLGTVEMATLMIIQFCFTNI